MLSSRILPIMRRLPLSLAFVLMAVACGGAAEAVSGQASASTDVQQSSEATTPPATGAAPSSTDTVTTPTNEGPPAPDFTLALGDGGSYTLSQGAKPVYMIFWAEW